MWVSYKKPGSITGMYISFIITTSGLPLETGVKFLPDDDYEKDLSYTEALGQKTPIYIDRKMQAGTGFFCPLKLPISSLGNRGMFRKEWSRGRNEKGEFT